MKPFTITTEMVVNVISLPSRADRRIGIMQNFLDYFVTLRFIDAVDGNTIDYEGKHKRGAAGCRLSHLQIIRKAKKENAQYVIIFEDDARFISPIPQGWQELLPPDWDIVYFGGYHVRLPEMINDQIGRCTTTLSTVAYAVSNRAYDTIIEAIDKDVILDMEYVRLNKENKIKAYAFYPNLVVQESGYSDIEEKLVNYDKFYGVV